MLTQIWRQTCINSADRDQTTDYKPVQTVLIQMCKQCWPRFDGSPVQTVLYKLCWPRSDDSPVQTVLIQIRKHTCVNNADPDQTTYLYSADPDKTTVPYKQCWFKSEDKRVLTALTLIRRQSYTKSAEPDEKTDLYSAVPVLSQIKQ